MLTPKLQVRFFAWMDPLNPRAGGDVRYLSEIGVRLVRDGHEVAWIASRFDGAAHEESYKGVRILRTGSIYSVYLSHHISRLTRSLPTPEITVETLSSIPFFVKQLGTRSDALLIHHVVPYHQMKRKIGLLAVLAFVMDRVVAPKIYRDRRVMVPSSATAEEVSHLGYRRVVIFQPGSDIPTSEPTNKEPIIVAPGPVKPWKNHQEIIEAFSGVDDKWRLVIFGSYESQDLHSRLRRTIDSLRLEKRVTLLGHIAEAEKLELLSKSSLCVIASEKEGWGLAAVEAQAYGCPVVAYDIPGLRGTVIDGQTGLLVNPHTVNRLTESIQTLVQDTEKLQRMGCAARHHAARFDWESSYRDFQNKMGLHAASSDG